MTGCALRIRRVFAAGDTFALSKFTHAADAMARIVIANAYFLPAVRSPI